MLVFLNYHPMSIVQMCADSSSDTDVCNGDSGGPMTIQRHNITYQIGVVSYGDDMCGRKE